MQTITAEIANEAGIHCRPTALITKEALKYTGKIHVTGPTGATCTLGSALTLLMMALTQGQRVTIRVVGPDEAATLARFKELFETHFDFPQAELQ